jgi:hypothetical protein
MIIQKERLIAIEGAFKDKQITLTIEHLTELTLGYILNFEFIKVAVELYYSFK